MKKRDDTVYLRDILDAVRQIEIYVDGISFVDFQNDRMRQDAIVRQLEIIGEASRNLTKTFQLQPPEINWRDITGMRHKLAHDYFSIDYLMVWDTVQSDLSSLPQWLNEQLNQA